MVGFRFVCLLQFAAVACLASSMELDGAPEVAQVQGAKEDVLPTNMEEMQAMISGAMKQSYKEDLGEDNAASTQADMKATMDQIAEREAVAEEMTAEEKRDCVVDQWTAWTKCNKKCGGGEISRERQVRVESQNGGESCPDHNGLHESASCNVESCADQKMDLMKTSRHLTDDERESETKYNNRVLKRAMGAPSVDKMMVEMHHWMQKNIQTQMVHVLAPGEAPPNDEELIQDSLKKAMAKNAVDNAMAGFEQEEVKEEKKAPTEKKT